MSTNKHGKDLNLITAVFLRYILVIVSLGVLFFLTAGTISYVNGWIYIITMIILMGIGFIVLFKKDKSLLEKRIKTGEKQKQQKIFVLVSGILIISMYALPGLDYRFKWSNVPFWLLMVSEFILIFGYLLNMAVMLQNSYASRVVEIQEGQKLIDTGFYSIVRHPMYSAIILIYMFSPLVLGSFIALIPGLLFSLSLFFRIRNEEKVLLEGLEGYAEYTKKVRYRLIPYLW